jgi:hypothetical protein
MSALHSACRDPVSFNAINNSISEDVPQGDAHQAWLNLHTIFNQQVQHKNMIWISNLLNVHSFATLKVPMNGLPN